MDCDYTCAERFDEALIKFFGGSIVKICWTHFGQSE